jgi:Holliday junction DNA helicase RuvA
MIAHLRGSIEFVGKDNLIVNVGNVGLRVYVPPLRMMLPALADRRSVPHLHIRENEWTLYGLPSQEELELFELLLGVSGVGARTALAVLSAASPEQLRSAIAHEQAEVLTRVPGIGPKTAKSIIFHLKDKVGVVTAGAQIAYLSDADTEVIAALTGLGYSIVEAQTALASLPRDASQDVEERIRLALNYFAK